MERVLEECDRADKGFDVEAVHDLRVALADVDLLPTGRFHSIRFVMERNQKAGEKFSVNWDTCHIQVMEEWIDLATAQFQGTIDPVASNLFDHLKSREESTSSWRVRDLASSTESNGVNGARHCRSAREGCGRVAWSTFISRSKNG